MKTRVKHKTQNTLKLFQLFQFFSGKIPKSCINLYNYIQKIFSTSVLGTAQLQFENILKLQAADSSSSSV